MKSSLDVGHWAQDVVISLFSTKLKNKTKQNTRIRSETKIVLCLSLYKQLTDPKSPEFELTCLRITQRCYSDTPVSNIVVHSSSKTGIVGFSM